LKLEETERGKLEAFRQRVQLVHEGYDFHNLLRQIEEMEQAINRNKVAARQANVALLENLLSSYNLTGDKRPVKELLNFNKVKLLQ